MASSGGGVPSYVPPVFRSWVSQAAAGTGLPAAVIAAQLQDESAFDASATSPTGAEGLTQFEPSTFTAEGGTGSEYDAQNELQPYIRFMSSLLSQYSGNVRNALAAYNAGSGDLSAGYGYADAILKKASEPQSETAGASSASSGGGGGLFGWPSEITGFFSDADHALGSASAVALALFRPSTYVRVAVGGLALIFLVLGILALAKAVK